MKRRRLWLFDCLQERSSQYNKMQKKQLIFRKIRLKKLKQKQQARAVQRSYLGTSQSTESIIAPMREKSQREIELKEKMVWHSFSESCKLIKADYV